jgi:hypothetical protein
MSIVYACNKKQLRMAAQAYAKEFQKPAIVPFCVESWYTEEQLTELERIHAQWLVDCEWLMGNDSCFWFIPYCAWCGELRPPCGDENEHDECDARLHYCSEQGLVEQEQVLTKEIVPVAPSVVIDNIMAFLQKKEA